ncbi:MAG: Gfo/Idh/MocA family oxidoreductase [Propionibacteriales bacterium]|nr:Gfo/Idh/MocA family oxidoreductase [Propionibacteriales bacterium]
MPEHRWRDAPDYRPRFPQGERLGIGILGCGEIAQQAHLPAYGDYDLDVVGVWSRTPTTTATVRQRFPFVRRIFATAEDLLDDPQVQVVDVATRPEGRLEWLAAAVSAGKHVLAQKPLTTDLAALAPVLDEADRRGVRIAVNQNGRWAPAWRLATLLVEAGAIGKVVGVTHLHDKPLPPIAGTHFDEMAHMLIADYLMHWIDITRCWLAGNQVEAVQARDHRTPGQPHTAKNPWAATVQIHCVDGADALVRIAGDVNTRRPACPFWIHGTEGTIRGSILVGSDFLDLERDGVSTRYTLDGEWFVDGFAGAMGELMCAVVENREPYHSAAHNASSLRLMLAARESAEQHGAAVPMNRLQL